MRVVAKKTIVADVSDRIGVEKQLVDLVFDALMLVILKRIEKGENFMLRGIGTIGTVPAKSLTSNMTGVTIPEHRRLRFKPNARFARKIRVATREYPIKN